MGVESCKLLIFVFEVPSSRVRVACCFGKNHLHEMSQPIVRQYDLIIQKLILLLGVELKDICNQESSVNDIVSQGVLGHTGLC